jgi:probable rRNA maturation factor
MTAPAKSTLPELVVLNRQRGLNLNLPWLRRFAALALPLCVEHSADGLFTLKTLDEVVVTIVSDRRIAAIHQDFMNIPGATDVITFQHGDVVVSVETAERYAREHGHGLLQELALYIVHGLLHLNGYLDGTPEDRAQMHAVQTDIWNRCLESCPA